LRGGLTAKHVDVPELCRVLRFEPGEAEILAPREASTGERIFETPADEFELAVLSIEEGKPWQSARSRGVEILLAIDGSVTVEDRGADESLALERGASVLIPDSVDFYELSGRGSIYRAGTPRG
jgi:mannose-6-phosphate isomerase